MLKRFLVLVLLFVPSSSILFAQGPPPDGLNGIELRTWLKENWYETYHNSLGYNNAREQMYSNIDNEGGNVYCIYSGFNQPAAFTTYLNPINAEHTVPQALFSSNEPMKSDIHHIFPTHQDVNSARGNLPFAESEDTSTDNWYTGDANGITNMSGIPGIDIDAYSEREINAEFEPREVQKGNIARAIFYFFTMYPTQAGDISQVGDVNILYQWHQADPPDAQEIIRNNKTKAAQGNYNPYINMPELVADAWNIVSSVDEVAGKEIQAYPNPTSDFLYLNAPHLPEQYALYDVAGRNVAVNKIEKGFDLSNLEAGVYFLELKYLSPVKLIKVIKR